MTGIISRTAHVRAQLKAYLKNGRVKSICAHHLQAPTLTGDRKFDYPLSQHPLNEKGAPDAIHNAIKEEAASE